MEHPNLQFNVTSPNEVNKLWGKIVFLLCNECFVISKFHFKLVLEGQSDMGNYNLKHPKVMD